MAATPVSAQTPDPTTALNPAGAEPPVSDGAAASWFNNLDFSRDTLRHLLEQGAIVGFKILVIVFVFVVIERIVRILLGKMEKHFVSKFGERTSYPKETEKRIATVFSILKKGLFVLLWILAVLITLKACGIDIGPILAAAGVLGLAVGLGAQSIVKDMFTGVILIIENHIRVNDVVTINGKNGMVEAVNLRTIVLRDATGTIHVIPNGLVSELSNQTIDWSATVINLTVAYDTDVDAVMAVMKQVGTDMKADPQFSGKIVEDLEMFGLTDFNDGNVNVRARIKTTPADQWTVEREYRRRLKIALAEAEIVPPSKNLLLSPKTESVLMSLIRSGKDSAMEDVAEKDNAPDAKQQQKPAAAPQPISSQIIDAEPEAQS